jgi:hypothetical protein
METEAIRIGVVMQRTPLNNRWQPYQWRPMEIVGDTGLPDGAPRCLRDDASDMRWLFTGFDIKLFTGEAEGYFLNITAPAPCWFVMWRIEELDGVEIAVPKAVTLSYNEAARLMDGGEKVDTLPAPDGIVAHLVAFTQQYYRPEPKKKRKRPSFEGGVGVERMAKAEGEAHGG